MTDLDQLDALDFDDIRFGGGGGTSDYWRGWNDGIDKAEEYLRESNADPATIRSLVAAARERDELRAALTIIRSVCDEPIDYLGGSHRIRMVIVPAIVAHALGEADMGDGLRRELFQKFTYNPAALHREDGTDD